MATKARQQYFADEYSLSKENREFSIADDIQNKIDSIEEGAQVNKIETVKVNGTALVPDQNKAINIAVPDVVDNLYTTSTDDALSAKQGKLLYDYIQNIASRGRFLSNWDCSTGLAITNPSQSPYPYKSGDYFNVSNVASNGGTNYRPDGSSYVIGQASTTVETEYVDISDFYFYDGTNWLLLSNSGRQIAIDTSLSTTSTNPVENRVITNAINNKQDVISDLQTIREGSALGSSSIQPGDSLSELSGTSDDITEGSTNLFMTNAERTKLSNITGINTGDETQETIKNKLGPASSTTDGYLTSEDWNTFNEKQDELTAGTDLEINEEGGESITVSGNNSITLIDAAENGLQSLTLYGGTEQSTTVTLNSVTLDGATVQRNLPEEYTQLEYIQDFDDTYIDLGMHLKTDQHSIELKVSVENYSSNNLFGARNSTTVQVYTIAVNGNKWRVGWGSSSPTYGSISDSNPHVLKVDAISHSFYVDGTLTAELSETRIETPRNAFLGGISAQTGGVYNGEGKIYYLKIWDNYTLIKYLLPAKRNSDNAIGMYDVVNNRFFTNYGSGNFTGGANAVPTPDVPINVVSNNGTIKNSINLFNKDNTGNTYGYYLNDSGTQIADNNSTISDYIVCEPNTTYTAQCIALKPGSNLRVHCYDSSKTRISMIAKETCNIGEVTTATGTTPNNAAYIKITGYTTSYASAGEDAGMLEKGATASSYVAYGVVHTEGIQEVVTDNDGNTATAQMLLGTGGADAVKDTQEVLSGLVTRNIGIKILDGTENWGIVDSGTPFYRLTSAVDNSGNLVGESLICTHFPSASVGSVNSTQGIRIYSNAIFWRYDDLMESTSANIAAFKQRLAEQYAQGTPVMLIYPVSNPTTETVAGQELIEAPVTQTAGSISNMTITVTSDGGEPTPSTPQDIICNNGILKYNTTTQTIYTEGDIETVEDELGNTATAEMLLKIGDYADEQEVLSGTVTRRIGIKVFDGTEELEEAISTSGRYRYTLAIPYLPAGIVYSTHFKGGKTISELNADTTITQAATSYSNKIYIYTATYSTLLDFKSFLATQYANGTPVIVIYPLATATTESVEGQTLSTIEGDNTITIIQSSLYNLGLSAIYEKITRIVIRFTNETGYITEANFEDITGDPFDNLALSSALNGKQDKSAMVTTLSDADNDHYPTAKAVSDAISSAGTADSRLVTQQEYDNLPSSKESDGNFYWISDVI